MKKLLLILTFCLMLTGCGQKSPQPVQLANPWVDYETRAEAEEAVGFSLELGDTVEGSYEAQSFRVMNSQLLEVVYQDGPDFQVTVRKMAGEDQNISGIYRDLKETYRKSEEGMTIIHRNGEGGEILTLISMNGYSYSLYAPNHYWGASMEGFVCGITGRR